MNVMKINFVLILGLINLTYFLMDIFKCDQFLSIVLNAFFFSEKQANLILISITRELDLI